MLNRSSSQISGVAKKSCDTYVRRDGTYFGWPLGKGCQGIYISVGSLVALMFRTIKEIVKLVQGWDVE